MKFYNQKPLPGDGWRKLGSRVARLWSLWSEHVDTAGASYYSRVMPGALILFSDGAEYEVRRAGNLVRLNKKQSRVKRLRALASARA